MKNIFSIIFFILFALHANAQDTITTTKGEEMNVKVLEVTSTLIKYKLSDTANTDIHTIETAAVFMIKYKNGSKDVFTKETNFITENYKNALSSDQSKFTMTERGKRDAKQYYRGYKGCVVCTVLTGAFTGLLVACACSSTPPGEPSLNYPDEKLMRDLSYSKAYRDQAFQIKRKKTWRAYGITAGAEVTLSVALLVMLASSLNHSSFSNWWNPM